MTSSINASLSAGVVTTADTSGSLALQTANTTAVTIDTSQNVGIGTTSPNSKLSVAVSSTSTSVLGSYANIPLLLQNTSSTDNNWSVIAVQDASGDFSSYIGTQNTSQSSNTAIMAFATNGGSGATERMRIDSSGNFLVGTTAPFNLNSAGSGTFQTASSDGQLFLRNSGASANFGWYLGANSSNQMRVYNQSGSGVLLTNGSTSWSSTSDERLKTDLAPIQDSLQKVSALRAVTGRFKTDEEGVSRSFLIAQDFENVFPQALDASDEDALSLKYTEVIPLLVASIKELKAINDTQAETINALTARVVALEGK